MYDLTSNIILAEDIELKSWVVYGLEGCSDVGPKFRRQFLSAVQAGALKEGRDHRIEYHDCGRYESMSTWVKGVKMADFRDEILWSQLPHE